MKPDLFESGHMICHGTGQEVLGLSWTSSQITHQRGNNLHHIETHLPCFFVLTHFLLSKLLFFRSASYLCWEVFLILFGLSSLTGYFTSLC